MSLQPPWLSKPLGGAEAMTVAAITFDFWSTLYRSTPSTHLRRRQSIESALAAAGRDDVSEAAVARAVEQAWVVWHRVWSEEHRTLGAAEWLDLVMDGLDVSLPTSVSAAAVEALQTAALDLAILPADGVPEELARLAPHYRLGVISDTGTTPGSVLRSLMERDDLLYCFDYLVFSDEFGRSKPHPSVFLSMLSHLEVDPREAAHIGDRRRTDVAGARGVGMRTVRYAGIRDDSDIAHPEADAVIETYDELEALLARWEHEA
jgi:putative hydrolase of the HAD superfamily